MKLLAIGLITLLTIPTIVFAQNADQMIEDMYKESFEKLSVGMTPEQKEKLKGDLEKQKQAHKENMKLSDSEMKVKIEEAEKKMNSAENKEATKKHFENMSPEEKEMHRKTMENANKMMKEANKEQQ
jgi:hypothetical protein